MPFPLVVTQHAAPCICPLGVPNTPVLRVGLLTLTSLAYFAAGFSLTLFSAIPTEAGRLFPYAQFVMRGPRSGATLAILQPHLAR